MKFLVDAQLPPGLCIALQARGHEAIHVFDIKLGGAVDEDIVDWVISNDAILISKDEDFLRLRLPDRFCFIWLRIGNATTRNFAIWLEARWSQVEALLMANERLIEVR
jgi:predicted nuclease of predicted toxin-antitoxin system